jgi:hypothetical protein
MRRPPPRRARRTWPPLRRLVTRLGVLGGLALILWAVENRTGWEALDADARAEAAARFSEEASRIATKPATTSAPSNTQAAPAAVGGDLAYLTPKRCLDLYQLAFERKLRPSQTARARRSRPRGTAPSRRARRGHDRVLRIANGRRAGTGARTLGRHRAPAHATATHGKRAPSARKPRVRRPPGPPRRRPPRPQSRESASPRRP